MSGEVESVSIWAPSRLELTLIDLSLGSRRVNGSAGIAISWPCFECRISRSEAIGIRGDGFAYIAEVEEFLATLVRHLNCDPVRVDVASAIPPHHGFGSKTATLLAVGRATAELYGRVISTPALAQLAKRARTSGVGANTFDRGGFLVDGGHPADPHVGESTDRFVPTRFSTRTWIPRALYAQPFPWPLLVIVPRGVIVEGELELDHFRAICPMPRAAAHEIAYIVCFLMTTAIAEDDYDSFCHAVNELQRAYLKCRELTLQSDEVRHVQCEAPRHAIDAIGLSSNGPALYALTKSPEVAERWLCGLRDAGTIEAFWWTKSPTSGAMVRRYGVEDVQP